MLIVHSKSFPLLNQLKPTDQDYICQNNSPSPSSSVKSKLIESSINRIFMCLLFFTLLSLPIKNISIARYDLTIVK
jgi:hypothetical protein